MQHTFMLRKRFSARQ